MGFESLLTKEKRQQLVWAKKDWKRQLEPLLSKHNMISRNYKWHWFRGMMNMSKVELEGEYYRLARDITSLEASIKEADEVLYADLMAREELQDYNMALDVVGTAELRQGSLFS